MNKSELIEAVADSSGLPKSAATRAVEAVFRTIASGLRKGDSVTIVGFGTFLVRQRNARMGRNPRTGEAISIAASRVPAFKAGKGLKEALQ